MSNTATTVTFNGTNLSNSYKITDVVRPFPERVPTTRDVSGRDGTVLAEVKYQPITISMKLTSVATERTARRTAMRTLMTLFNVDEPKKLQFSDDTDLWYYAIPAGEKTGDNRINRFTSETMAVQFFIPDPVMYKGASMATPSKSSNNYTFTGNYPCKPVFTVVGAQPNSSGYYGIKMDDSLIIKVPLSSGSHAVTIDCDARTVTVDNANVIPTIDSDWFVCTPGTHKIVRYLGSNTSLSVAYWPRWL